MGVWAFYFIVYDKIKCNFFQAAVVSILQYGCSIKRLEKKQDEKLHKNATAYIEQNLEATSHEKAFVRPLPSHL